MKKCFWVFLLFIFVFTACGATSNEYSSIEAIDKYLSSATGGGIVNDPLLIKVNMDLQNMLENDSRWKQLLRIINKHGKYIALDLSNCKMFNTEFNPDPNFEDGKKYIVLIVLPKITKSITETKVDNRGRASAFKYFENIENVVIPEGVEYIDDFMFEKFTNLKSISIPASVIDIGRFAFSNCTSLEKVIIAEGSELEIIDDLAFYQCTSLKSIMLPSGLLYIGVTAFSGSGLENIIIPENVKVIEQQAFGYCSNLTNVTILATEPPEMGEDVFSVFNMHTSTSRGMTGSFVTIPALRVIYVPADSVNSYKSAKNWNAYSDIILAK